jgi:nitrogenase subunit NifH
MKTAMQELIDKLKIESNFITKDDHIEDRMFKKGIDLAIYISNHLLEKEKEQIIDAYENKVKEHLFAPITSINKRTGKEYYNQTYNKKEETLEEWKSKFTHHCAIKDNQKKHIIDIMKADEDDGLYKMFDTDSDKKH